VSRTARIARALTVGYGYQAVVAVTGLVLTPFLLSRLGVVDLGRWLVAGQVLGLLGLLDLGVTAVLPREVARASGSEGPAPVAEVVRRAWWLVWLQTPLVGLVAVGVWFGVSSSHPDLNGPLAVILAGFVVLFPLRVPGAVLTGLQELTFCAGATALGWAVTTAVSVGLVFAGWGLYALAAGWAVGQLVTCGAAWWRVRAKFPQTRSAAGWPGRAAVGAYLRPSLWTSLRQLAVILANGTDLIVVGWVLGPAGVVVFSCTSKLASVVANQPNALLLQGTPALAELRAAGDPERMWAAARALFTGVLLLSGGLGVVILAVNRAFVAQWVGPDVFGGPLLSLFVVLAMWSRHWAFTLMVAQYTVGRDRRLAVSAIIDGIVSFVTMVGLTALVGPVGVPLGMMAGALGVSGVVGLFGVARDADVSPSRVLLWYAPWALRLGASAAAVATVGFVVPTADPVAAAGLLVGGVVAYLWAASGLLRRDPLRQYWLRGIEVVRRTVGAVVRGGPRVPPPAVPPPS
jgi:O-antigen/teichoic acid export membrane protein